MSTNISKKKSEHFVEKIFKFICGVLIGVLCMCSSSYAHRVNIYAYAENGMVHAEGYFVDGTKCKNCRVEVIDEKNGSELIEGNTDENGALSFEIPKITSLKLILHAGMGHQSEYILAEDEVREAAGKPKAEKAAKNMESKSELKEITPRTGKIDKLPSTTSINTFPDSSEIEAIVEKVTDRKMQPVMKMLVKLQENSEKPGITEIIGGIGYILGIMGIIMYFKSRYLIAQRRSKKE